MKTNNKNYDNEKRTISKNVYNCSLVDVPSCTSMQYYCRRIRHICLTRIFK